MSGDKLSVEDLDRLRESMAKRHSFDEARVFIGSGSYTYAEILALEEKYFPGFLLLNPHYPAPGWYRNPDGSTSWPEPIPKGTWIAPTIPEEPVMINGFLWDKVSYADEEENNP